MKTGKLLVENIDGYTAWTPKQLKNFWRKVDKNGDVPKREPELGRCWNWIGGVSFGGYGVFGVFRIMRRAHRVSWLIHHGAIPYSDGYFGTCVLHKCDNPSCVNPNHLFLGTHTDNMRDMERKGRSDHPKGERNGTIKHPEIVRGENNGMAKLNDFEIIDIRRFYGTGKFKQVELASKYKVSQAMISSIVLLKRWSHVKTEPR